MDASGSPARVLLLGLDGFPPETLSPEATPVLWALGESGGRAGEGGIAALPATTYPGFASLLTGASMARHGVRTTHRRRGAVPGWAGRRRVRVPTLLHAAREAGLGAAAVLGDQHLHEVLRLGSLTRWPARGVVPARALRDAHGYPVNAAVRGPLLAALAEPGWSVLFAHLNEADTLGHDLGPDASATRAIREATDALVGEALDVLRPGWARTLVLVVSDHGMAAVGTAPPVDLEALVADPACGVGDWIGDAAAGWARVARGADRDAAAAACAAVDGVSSVTPVGRRRLLLIGEPGREFAAAHAAGTHGGPATSRTVAIAGGGLAAAVAIGARIAAVPPRLEDWAPTIASVLGFALPDAEGTPLAVGDGTGWRPGPSPRRCLGSRSTGRRRGTRRRASLA